MQSIKKKYKKTKKTLKNKPGKYVVYTRAYYEEPYLDFFIEHYIKLGFDLIIILISESSKYKCPKEFQSYVKLQKFTKNLGDGLLNKYDYLIKKKKKYSWILDCDVDEFLFLNNEYNDIKEYVNSKILFEPKINIFYFRWAMIEKIDNKNIDNFNDLLIKYPLYNHFCIKSMFKSSDYESFENPHTVKLNTDYNIYFEGKTYSNFMRNNSHNNPHQSFNYDMYKDSVLIHYHSRNLNNTIMKSIFTVFNRKADIEKLQNLINHQTEINLEDFINALTGTKKNKINMIIDTMKLSKCNDLSTKYNSHICPLNTNLQPLVNMSTMKKYNYSYKVINRKSQDKMLIDILKKNNIKSKMYFYHIKYIEKKLLTKLKNMGL